MSAVPLTPRSAGSYLLFGFCLEKCISTGHSSTRTKKKRGEQMEREQKTIRLPAELKERIQQEAEKEINSEIVYPSRK